VAAQDALELAIATALVRRASAAEGHRPQSPGPSPRGFSRRTMLAYWQQQS